MARLGLTVNEAKTAVRDPRRERFDSLATVLDRTVTARMNQWYLGASPSRKSVQRLKGRVGKILLPYNTAP